MNNNVKYVLDANIFIQAFQEYYAFDIAPSFWDELIDKAQKDSIISIDQIMDELEYSKNGLTDWAKNEFRYWFMSCSDQNVYNSYTEIMNWAQHHSQFTQVAKDEFARVADGWVLAYAKAYDYIIVTHEAYDANIKKRIKIPNVCEAFGISYTNTFNMLRDLRIKIG